VDVVDIEREFPDGIPEEHFQARDAKIFTVIGRVRGRVPGYDSQLVMSIARRGRSIVWVMESASILRGRVVDQQRDPVVGAQISIGIGFGPRGSTDGVNKATTDAKGEYVIDNLARLSSVNRRPSFSYQTRPMVIIAKHPKFVTGCAGINKQIPGKVDFQLVPGSVIEGTVQFPKSETNTKSLAGSLVRLQPVIETIEDFGIYGSYRFKTAATIDEAGHYRFELIPAGKYNLTTDIEGWVTQGIENMEVAEGETAAASDIPLTRGGRIRVQLVDDKTGEPIRFEEPTKGSLHTNPRPQRAAFFASNHMAEFSKDGVGEIQVSEGRYSISVSIPIAEGGNLTSIVTDDLDKKSIYEVVDGEQLHVCENCQ